MQPACYVSGYTERYRGLHTEGKNRLDKHHQHRPECTPHRSAPINSHTEQHPYLPRNEKKELRPLRGYAFRADLPPGVYHFRTNSYNSGTGDLGDEVITGLNWGSVGFGEEIEGSPPDAPKSQFFELNPQPYVKMLNGKLAIEYKPVNDELLVEIGEKLRAGTEQGGERGDRFTYTYIVYQGVALDNLTKTIERLNTNNRQAGET